MADRTQIEWADATWNPVTGCQVVSPGCTNCYAMRLTGTRLKHQPSRAGLTQNTKAGPVWTGEVRFNEAWIDQPLHWRRSRRIFVCAHGDLFAEGVPDTWIDRVFATMALAPQHIFLVLTKRAARMRRYVSNAPAAATAAAFTLAGRLPARRDDASDSNWDYQPARLKWPLPNVWLGVSVEDQARADERIPLLLDTPAAKRFISAEPLLGPVDLARICILPRVPGCAGFYIDALIGGRYTTNGVTYTGSRYTTWDIDAPPPETRDLLRRLDWVIAGGESGPGARGCPRAYGLSLRDQCVSAGVPFFWKQNGEWIDADEWLATVRRDAPDGWCPEPPLNFTQASDLASACGRGPDDCQHHSDGTTLIRVGKRAAGRLLDGREWSELPGIQTFAEPPDDDPGDAPDLGPCCLCERRPATTLVTLDRRAAVPGHGWGCVICGLPPDGASAVLCQACTEIYEADPDRLKIACRGYPASDGRVPIADLDPAAFEHDLEGHIEEERGASAR